MTENERWRRETSNEKRMRGEREQTGCGRGRDGANTDGERDNRTVEDGESQWR